MNRQTINYEDLVSWTPQINPFRFEDSANHSGTNSLELGESFATYLKGQIFKPEQVAIIKALQEARIDPNVVIKPDPVLLDINGKAIATLGNFLLIIGKAKSKKTFFVLLLLAAVLFEKKNKISGHSFIKKERIIWFDTEQARFHVSKALNRLMWLGEGSVQAYKIEVYDLRPRSPKERKAMIDFVLNEQNPNNDIAFVVIDGLRDTLFDINNPEEASETIGWLMKLTEEKDLHITTILHENKGDRNPRGHVGTEAMNKAETTLSTVRDSDNPGVSIVKPEYMRGEEFDPIAFKVGDDGLPYVLEDHSIQEKEKPPKRKPLTPQSIPEESHYKILKAIFQKESQDFGYTELFRQVKLEYQTYGILFGDNKAKEFVSYFQRQGWIGPNSCESRKSKYRLLISV